MTGRTLELLPLDIDAETFNILVSTLLDYCNDYDLLITNEQATICVKHLLYIVQLNEKINLTRITNIDEALVLHVLDSLLFCKMIPTENEVQKKILDMGTGAGFPGVPLIVSTNAHVTLLDSVGKKVNAVDMILEELGVDDYDAVHNRTELYALEHRAEFDFVVARALASLPILIEYATPFLNMGGSLVLSKGNPTDDELESGKHAAHICGLELVEQQEFELPHSLGHRMLLRYTKVAKSSIKLPRSAGAAKRNPLA